MACGRRAVASRWRLNRWRWIGTSDRHPAGRSLGLLDRDATGDVGRFAGDSDRPAREGLVVGSAVDGIGGRSALLVGSDASVTGAGLLATWGSGLADAPAAILGASA